jgi:hypothetical protein
VRLAKQPTSQTDADFAGAPTLADRTRMLRGGCAGWSKCGFMAPSGYDALAAEASAASEHCAVVTVTAIFGSKDKLQQPAVVPPELAECFFALVDEQSAAFLLATAPKAIKRAGTLSTSRVGAWRLLTLRSAAAAYAAPRRASRVPKLLPFRFFPHANYSLWVDGKLRLLASPRELVARFLTKPKAALALPRNVTSSSPSHAPPRSFLSARSRLTTDLT